MNSIELMVDYEEAKPGDKVQVCPESAFVPIEDDSWDGVIDPKTSTPIECGQTVKVLLNPEQIRSFSVHDGDYCKTYLYFNRDYNTADTFALVFIEDTLDVWAIDDLETGVEQLKLYYEDSEGYPPEIKIVQKVGI